MGDCSLKQLDPVIEKYKDKSGKLLPVLHEIQNRWGYIPLSAQKYVSEKLKIPISKIYGVVSFYSFFSLEPKGEYTIGMCMGTACYVKGGDEIIETIKEELGIEDIGDTSEDQRFTLTITRCVGTCSMAPVMMIDDKVYGDLTQDKVLNILKQY